MKQICTLLALVCLLVITQNAYAQNSVADSTTFPNPAPNPSFSTADSVNLANGFTSNSTGTFYNFPKGKTTTIVSPYYSYLTDQSVVYFVYNMSTSAAANTVAAPEVAIITANGDTLKATANPATFAGPGTTNYYFTFRLAAPLLANTAFKISFTMTLANNDKAVSAFTLATNAPKATGKAPTPLPVKFSGFTAKKVYDAVSLTWTVGIEENVAGYEVQKSTDGNSFSRIGFVAARGVSSYTYVDSKVNETAFYRVRSVDNDSKYIYSSILTLKGDQSDVVMKAFPSPVQSQLTVQHSSTTSNGKIDVLSVDGRLFKSIALAAGTQQTSVDLSSAKAGIYIVRLITGNTIQSIKVTKQ
jgi:hypothetical protein